MLSASPLPQLQNRRTHRLEAIQVSAVSHIDEALTYQTLEITHDSDLDSDSGTLCHIFLSCLP